MSDEISISPDMDLANKLRQNFTATACVEALLRAVADMSSSVGVEVSWSVVSVNDEKIVDKEALKGALGRLATSGGALLMGGKVNPIAQDPLAILKEKRKEHGQ